MEQESTRKNVVVETETSSRLHNKIVSVHADTFGQLYNNTTETINPGDLVAVIIPICKDEEAPIAATSVTDSIVSFITQLFIN